MMASAAAGEKRLRLYATGFNAWNQLIFGNEKNDEPEDLFSFTEILEAEGDLDVSSGLSYTCVTTQHGKKLIAGEPDEQFVRIPDSIKLWARAGNGKISFVHQDTPKSIFSINLETWRASQPDCTTFIFESQDALEFKLPNPITQLVANTTGFMALDAAGIVYTWGDPRFAACLGREISNDSPSDEPSPVPLLLDLDVDPLNHSPTAGLSHPIKKIASGGYISAVVTESHDLYIWGSPYPVPSSLISSVTISNGSQSPNPGEQEDWYDSLLLSSEPTPVDSDYDFMDVALGEKHLLATGVKQNSEHKEFVVLGIGDNHNGQLGMDRTVQGLRSWTALPVDLGHGRIEWVKAGERCSFVGIID